jgi:hypothetical protein
MAELDDIFKKVEDNIIPMLQKKWKIIGMKIKAADIMARAADIIGKAAEIFLELADIIGKQPKFSLNWPI